MEPFTLDFLKLPHALEDICVQFAYWPIKNAAALHTIACATYMTSKALPVPTRWKKCLLQHGDFDWRTFLNTERQPYNAETLISLPAVRFTVRLLNWHHVRSLHTTAACWALYLQKKLVMARLKSWTPKTLTLVFLIQRLLCALDFPRSLNRTDIFEMDAVMIHNTNPLCMYVRPPSFYL